MRGNLCLISGVVCLWAAGAALGQEQPTSYVLSTYYVCDQNREDWADTLTEHFLAPIYNRQVEEGRLAGWGYLGHHHGGSWRRVFFMAGADLGALLDTRDSIIGVLHRDQAAAGRELSGICPDHEDYIWQSLAGSVASAGQLRQRPPAAYSTYFYCDASRQDRADQIIREAFAPALDRLEKEGKIVSWGWMAHVLGGQYRRLMTYAGTDHKTLLAVVDQYQDQLDPALRAEFRSICGPHNDYLWNTIASKP